MSDHGKEPLAHQRRATDGILSANPSNSDIVKLLLDMQRQLDVALGIHANISRAFKKNRYGEPDFDKHYDDHDHADKAKETMDLYKADMTKTAISWATKGLLTLLVAGVLAMASVKLGVTK